MFRLKPHPRQTVAAVVKVCRLWLGRSGVEKCRVDHKIGSKTFSLSSAQPDAMPQGLQGLQPEGLSGAECLEPSCLMPQFSQPEGSEPEPGHGSMRDHPLSLKPLGSGYRPQKPLEQGQEQAPRTPPVGPLGFRPDSPQSVPLGFRPESRGPGKKTGQPCTGRSPALNAKVDFFLGQHSFPPVPPKGLGFSPEPLGLQSQKDAPATLAPFPGEEAEAQRACWKRVKSCAVASWRLYRASCHWRQHPERKKGAGLLHS